MTDTYDIARMTLDIIPLVMRVMSGEMRSTDWAMNPGQMPVMGALIRRRYTLSDLAERLSVSAPSMSATVSTLEARGWLTRERDTDDRRIVWIALTEEGQRAYEDSQRQVAERIALLLEPLSSDEREQLAGSLELLASTFAQAMERDPLLRQT
ncbi:MAG TPA: MarR family transcriptional regulator [Candidatus Limnocylindrales bacterium]|nr:MarR family transcriptional regulator [Candidatus Limnocylindrales bacterium]